jgi:hypothetical protein
VPRYDQHHRKDLWSSLECSPPCQGGGRGFKSRQVRSRGRSPDRPSPLQALPQAHLDRGTCRFRWSVACNDATSAGVLGQVAQLVEHTTENRGVGGSIPPLTTFWRIRARRGVCEADIALRWRLTRTHAVTNRDQSRRPQTGQDCPKWPRTARFEPHTTIRRPRRDWSRPTSERRDRVRAAASSVPAPWFVKLEHRSDDR